MVVAPDVNLTTLCLDASDGGHQEDDNERRAAHCAEAEYKVEGLVDDWMDGAADFPHMGAGEDGGSGYGYGDGDGVRR